MRISIESATPAGRGYGSSTTDCTAGVRALASFAGRSAEPAEIASITACAERAMDPTMYGLEPLVFLPRLGVCLERFRWPWPALHVAPADLGGAAVDTDNEPMAAYTQCEIDEFERLLDAAAGCFARGDAGGLAAIGTRSAEIHQRHRPHPGFAGFVSLAAGAAACGLAVSHSGTAAALLLPHPVPGSYSLASVQKEDPCLSFS